MAIPACKLKLSLIHLLIFSSLGVDKVALVAIICYRSNGQRQTLNEKYRSMFGKVK